LPTTYCPNAATKESVSRYCNADAIYFIDVVIYFIDAAIYFIVVAKMPNWFFGRAVLPFPPRDYAFPAARWRLYGDKAGLAFRREEGMAMLLWRADGANFLLKR